MKKSLATAALVALVAARSQAADPPKPSPPASLPVTVENFVRAESDTYMAKVAADGGFGKFLHFRDVTPIDRQTVIRMNRDTLYSAAVFDLEAGPVTIVLPNSDGRFLSMQIIDEDHYVPSVVYTSGAYTYSREQVGTRYMLVALRILVDPSDARDLGRVRLLQDSVKVEQKSPGRFEIPPWDADSQKKVRDALLVLGATLPDSKRTFGRKIQVDPVRHLIGTALAWGGNPERDALYVNVTPRGNDGKKPFQLTVGDVPVDGFWSISVYNAKGYFEKNARDAYTINNLTAKKNDKGEVRVQFGACGAATGNCLPIVAGWNYIVRLYRPRAQVLDGKWTFPEAAPMP